MSINTTLFIYPNDDVKLDPYHHFSHNLAVRLYDDLVRILKDEKIAKKIDVKIKLKEGDVLSENQEDVLLWLENNGYIKESQDVVSKHLMFALISDVCHYIFQALDSAKNIKMTVALNLLRKPFLEHLLIIEQLLVKEEDFLRKFQNNPDDFDPGKIKDEEKKSLIEKAISQINSSYLLDANVLFEFRWNKKNSDSIYASSNLATHLVTTRHSSYKTTSRNLNMIFSRYEEWDSQLSYFYFLVPYLLFYMTEVVDQYLVEKKVITSAQLRERKFKRLIGQMLQHDQFDEKSIKGKSLLNKITKNMKVKCLNCNRVNQLFKSDLFNLVAEDYILCKHCLSDLVYETNSMKTVYSQLFKD